MKSLRHIVKASEISSQVMYEVEEKSEAHNRLSRPIRDNQVLFMRLQCNCVSKYFKHSYPMTHLTTSCPCLIFTIILVKRAKF